MQAKKNTIGEKGFVKYYNSEKHYGFITTNSGDLFFHDSSFVKPVKNLPLDTSSNTYEVEFKRKNSQIKQGKQEAFQIIIKCIKRKNKVDLWERIRAEIVSSKELSQVNKKIYLKNFDELIKGELHILFAGGCGSGKSTTINAIFNKEVAKVGKIDPETQHVSALKLDNLFLHDTPGLGESTIKDQQHKKKIINELKKKNRNGQSLIDVVLIILDGASRDMNSAFELINDVIIPNKHKEVPVIIAINKCDLADGGKGWNRDKGYPNHSLKLILDQKVKSVRNRVKAETGVNVDPIYYSGEYKYNISKLLSYIIEYTPQKKRVFYYGKINEDSKNFKSDDISVYENEKSTKTPTAIYNDYSKKVTYQQKVFNYMHESLETVDKELSAGSNQKVSFVIDDLRTSAKGAVTGLSAGVLIGTSVLPGIGSAVGATIGLLVGGLGGFITNKLKRKKE